jgi:secondary thiamine-phosphate synthase enzyme
MATKLFVSEEERAGVRVCHDRVELRTRNRIQFVDLTELVAERVRRSGVAHGLVSVQALHTTAAVLVNENEPLLLEDMGRILERAAPQSASYAHDDLSRRAGPIDEERRNGSAHCRAALLGSTACLHVAEGRLLLGTWQRVFLVELDGPRPRSVSVMVLGSAECARA